MAELNVETQQWLQTLKLNKKFTSIADFQNGYNFGLIFDRLQLSKGKKFKNSSDLGCVFQNYKNVRDLLLQNFNYDFPVNNIIYRTDDLLKVLRQEAQKYTQRKKANALQATKVSSSEVQKSFINKQQQKQFKTRQLQLTAKFNQTAKLPKKIQDIQRKLDKYKQQKVRHELIALEERKQQIEQYRKIVQSTREFQINKLRKFHEQGKQKQRKVYDVWYKTEQIKNNRIAIDKQFQNFQKEKKNQLLQSLRQDQVDTINRGLQMFQLNCMRQGIQLEHDPDKPLKLQGQFNKVVVMERMKDQINKNQLDKKQRVKRENKKRIDAQQAKIKSEQVWAQLNKIEDYSQKFKNHFKLCQETYKIERRLEAEQQVRKNKCGQKKYVELPAFEDEETRNQQFKQRKIQYMFQDADRMQKRYNNIYSMAEEVVEGLLQVAIQTEQTYLKNQGFTYGQWKAIQQRFLKFRDTRKSKSKDTQLYMDYSTFNYILKQYLHNQGSWRNFDPPKLSQISQSQLLIRAIAATIQKVYPDKVLDQVDKIALYMPLKICLYGPTLSGKSTFAAKLSQKYGLSIINPKQIIKEALQLAKPPVQEDPKKANKKDSKKPQELTPEKIALKQFGVRLLQSISSVQQAQITQICEAIKFKINQNFVYKNNIEATQDYLQAKQKQKLKHQQALKEFEEAQKKPKKDLKKGGPDPVVEEPPKSNQIFYSSGFVIDELIITEQTMRALQKQMTGFISDDERINIEGVKMRQLISQVLPIPQPPKDTALKSGTFDFLLALKVTQSQLNKRKAGRKMDPQTKHIYHSTFNPAPQIKGFAQKLVQLPIIQEEKIIKSLQKFRQDEPKVSQFYSNFGLQSNKLPAFQIIDQKQQTMPQVFDNIARKIQLLLKEKYVLIQKQNNNQRIKENQKIAELQVSNQNLKNNQEVENTQANQSSKQNGYIGVEEVIRLQFSDLECKQILNKYKAVVINYEQGIKQCLFKFEIERANFMKELLGVQRNFTNLINRPDDKAGKILEFQQNYNKLLLQQSNIVKDIQASKHLIQRLSQLYNSLWSSIEIKKNESVEQRQKFKKSNWLNTQAEKIVQIGKKLLQIELNYLCQTIFVILTISCILHKKPSDYVNEYLSLGIDPKLQTIASISSNSNDLLTNDRFNYYLEQANKCITTLQTWIEQKHRKMKIPRVPTIDILLNEFVANTIANLKIKQQIIGNKLTQRILEQRSYYQSLLNKMDDWIIHGIKSENDFVYDIYKSIKKCIEQAKKSNIKELHVKQITQVFYPIKQLTGNPIPLRVVTKNKQLPIYSFMVFFEEIKTLANAEGRINFQVFVKYMDKRKKSKLLDEQILKINYDTVQQFLVKQNYLYLRELALAIILWDVHVFDDEQLANYKQKLLKIQPSVEQTEYRMKKTNPNLDRLDVQSEQQKQQSQKLLQQEAKKEGMTNAKNGANFIKKQSIISAFPTDKRLSLEELVLMGGAFDDEEQYIIKHFVFQIFRQRGTDYVYAQNLLDTLSLFDQLQVLKYGDTVMMLNI